MLAAPRRRVLWTCVSAVACAFLSYFFLVPVYPMVAHDLGVGPDALAAVVGVGQLLAALLQIPAGVASDRYGRRPFLVASLAVIAASQVLRWVPGGLAAFAIAQSGVGLCLPVIVSAASAAVADAYSGAGRAQAFGILLASVNVGQVVGYLLMGGLAGMLGWRDVSLALAALPAGLALLALRMPEPPRIVPAGPAAARIRATVRFLASAAPAAMLAVVALVVGAGNSSAYLLPFVDRAQGIGPQATGILLLSYVTGSVVLAPLTGRVADRVGIARPLLAWTGAGALAAAAFALLGPHPAWVPPCYLVLGGAVGSGTSLAAARMADLAEAAGGPGVGAALGGLRSAQSLGPALGPPLAALVYVGAGFRAAFLALAAACAAAMLVVATLSSVTQWAASPPGARRSRSSGGP